MKRLISAILILVLVTALSVASSLFLKNATKNLEGKLEEIYQLSEQKEFDKAKEKIRWVCKEYENSESWFLVFIRSTPLEKIEEQLSSLEALAEYQDSKLLCSEVRRAQALITHLWKAEQITISNII